MSIGDKNNTISLIESCIAGDTNAQKKMYTTHSPVMYAICLRYLKNEHDAKDALQNGFIRVFNNLAKFENRGNFEGWMKRIFSNSSIELIRKRKLHENVEFIKETNLPKISESSNVDYDAILKLIEHLPMGYRTVFNMFVIDGFSHQEIAEKLQISESTSKSQLFKARKQLQAWLKNWFDKE